MPAAITAENLTIKFGDFTAVRDVTFSVERGEIFGFLGPNGSGKTTIIKALCGLVPIASGGGSILGLNVLTQSNEIKRRIGYMSQKFGLYEDLTVTENLDFYGGVYGLTRANLEKRKKELIDLTTLGPYLNRRAQQLSGGWKQRLALACALVHSPEVVFLDEPTAGIDPVARRALWDLLFTLSGQGVTFFVTTHYMDEAERCSRVGYIYLSKLIAVGTVEEVQRIPEANPPGTVRMEVRLEHTSNGLQLIRQLPYVHESTIFGRSVHVLIEEKEVDRLRRDLLSSGAVGEIVPAEASLEDVFVTLTNRIAKEQAS
ncbi:MAG: ABC transporter ATP-binding protein [Acidobacteriota bacterium]